MLPYTEAVPKAEILHCAKNIAIFLAQFYKIPEICNSIPKIKKKQKSEKGRLLLK